MPANKKLNVLQFICPTGFYGAERWIIALANSMDTERFQGDLVVTMEEPEADNPLIDLYPAAVGKTHILQEHGKLSLATVTELCELIRSTGVDIIHTHGYKSDILGVLAAKRTGIKSVTTAHGFDSDPDFKLGLYYRAGGVAFRYFDIVAPLSPELFEHCEQYRIAPEKLRLIPNGVDLTEIDAIATATDSGAGKAAEKATESDNGTRWIGYIGRLSEGKYVKDLVAVFAILAPDYPELKMRIVGDGPEREALEAQAQTLGLADRIDFMGFRKDRLELMQDLEIFGMASRKEGTPRVMMEAMALKVPVAAYDIPGVRELIIDGDTGLLAEFGDTDALAAQFRLYLDDPDRAGEFGQRGRGRIEDHFSGQALARKYESLFVEIMG